jgi:flagella basal body P-ring formation protein FlgA
MRGRTSTLTILFISLLVCSAWSDELVIKLHDATVTSPFVSLDQIASILCSDPQLLAELRSIRILRSPLPGLQRRVSPRYVLRKLASAGIDLKSVKIEAPKEITIRRKSFKIKGAQIAKFARETVLKALSKKGWNVRTVSISNPGAVVHPFEKVKLKAGKPRFGMGNSILQPVEIWSGEKVFRTIPVYIRVEASGNVFLAARDISAGERISGQDVVVRPHKSVDLSLNPVSSLDQIKGQRLKRSVKSGQMLRLDMFEPSDGLRPDDIVQVELRSKNLIIRFPAKLISIGASREAVIVNPASGKRLKGLLEGDKIVVRLNDE